MVKMLNLLEDCCKATRNSSHPFLFHQYQLKSPNTPRNQVDRPFGNPFSVKHFDLMSSSTVAVSAPGKVLFTGGFLVLDRKHTGLVFGLNARIHVHVQSWTGPEVKLIAQKNQEGIILVRSPQFKDAQWLYTISTSNLADGRAVTVEQIVE